MLGNDIIDLQKAVLDSNWKRKGYLDKIFSQEEKHQILNSENPFQLVWLFWSMKEAVYKIINRETGLRFYSPTAFTCKNNLQGQKNEGEVHYKGKTYYTQSRVTEQIIHTMALSRSNLVGSIAPMRLPFNEVEIVYLANSSSYAEDFNSSSNTYNLTKNEYGIPELIHRNTGAKQLASVSHHGKFLAIVFLPNALL
jgi:phosphopantetheinyl transferase (holo-ACP synthase)